MHGRLDWLKEEQKGQEESEGPEGLEELEELGELEEQESELEEQELADHLIARVMRLLSMYAVVLLFASSHTLFAR